VRLIEATATIEVDVRPRRGSKARCSCCGKPASGYDVLPVRRFEFIPIWGYAVMLLYAMRRVQCARCGVKVEQVPWAIGKHSLTKAYMLYLAHWARKLSWKETASSFGTTWDQVCHAVEYVVQWGLAHRARRQLSWPVGVNYLGRWMRSSFLFVHLVFRPAGACPGWAARRR
jgi:transposase